MSWVWIAALAVFVALEAILGSTLLQLGRTRSIIPILTARTKVDDFKDNFFMFILRFED